MVASIRAHVRPRLGLILLAPLALVLSCAEMPTAPTRLVHLQGNILDRDGQAMGFIALGFWVEGVRLGPLFIDPANIPPGEPDYYRAITRSDGAFDLWLPARSYLVEIIPWAGSGYAPAVIPSAAVKGDAPKLNYQYSWPRVTIHTVLQGGGAISGSFALLSPDHPPPDGYPSGVYYFTVQARPNGNSLQAVVPPTSYRVFIQPGGSESGFLAESRTLSVAGDTTITVTAGGNTVSARVLGQNGIPLSGASVSARNGLSRALARTGSDGIAVFHLPTGGYTWTVQPSESFIASREFPYRATTGDEAFDLDVSGTDWSGTVRRAGDGAPLPEIYVGAFAQGTAGYSSAYVESDAGGAFHLIVQKNVAQDIRLVTQSGDEVGFIRGVFAGNDSTFDLFANVPVP